MGRRQSRAGQSDESYENNRRKTHNSDLTDHFGKRQGTPNVGSFPDEIRTLPKRSPQILLVRRNWNRWHRAVILKSRPKKLFRMLVFVTGYTSLEAAGTYSLFFLDLIGFP